MKSNKGVAMISLVIYVASFLVITTLVGTISTYFYNNMDLIDSTVGGSADYNKLNLYIASLIKNSKLTDVKVGGDDLDGDGVVEYGVLAIYHGDDCHYLVRSSNQLYYNNILLCSNIENFTSKLVYRNGKEILVVNVKIAGVSFATEYVIG